MALYELDDRQVKFMQEMISKVLPQGTREEIRAYIVLGDKILEALKRPIQPAGKPKEIIQPRK